MGRRANPYPGWWASPDRDSDDEPIGGPCWKDVPEDLPPEYKGKCKYTRQKDNRYEWEKYESYGDGFKSGFWDNFFFGSAHGAGHQQSFSFDIKSEPYEDPYNILGMKKSDSNDDLKKGYYKKAKIHHPDRGGKKELFQKLSNAWDQIKFWRDI
jgi:hypothetical protein